MKKKPASAPGKTKKPTKTLETYVGAPPTTADIPTAREGYEVIDEKAGNYFYNTKTGQPEPISKPSAPKADWEFTGSWTGKTDGDQDEAVPTPFPTEAPDSGQTDAETGSGQDGLDEVTGTEASATPLATADDRQDASFPTEATEQTGRTESSEKARPDAAGDGNATQSTAIDLEKNTGEVAFLESPSGGESVDKSSTIELSSRAERLPGEGRSACHERLRRLARAEGMPRGQGPGTAYNWAFEETNRIFARLNEPEPAAIVEESPVEELIQPAEPTSEPIPEPVAVAPAPIQDDQGVSGLSELPPGWPELPANAQLQVEIAWVTANRLRVRDGTGVNLSRALSPAPSYSALSWLETSILFPAKFADISVKATAQQDDEREFVKREKMAIEEIRSILSEMLEAKG